MPIPEISDPVFQEALSAMDAGQVSLLERLLEEHPRLVRDRIDYGEGYFHKPYLLWFVAENPVRTGRLPGNIVDVARVILRAASRMRVDTLREQTDYALSLVSSGRIARESGAQLPLIDVFCDAGADPGGAVVPALAHRELPAARRLLERGAPWTLLAAVCMGESDAVEHLARAASAKDRQLALAGAAFYGRTAPLSLLLRLGVDLNAYSPAGFHPHATALHHAVDSGSLDAVRMLVEAGAKLDAKDRVHQGTPLDWARYLERREIATYLQAAATGAAP